MLLLNFSENKPGANHKLVFKIKFVLDFKKRDIWTSEPRNEFQSIPFEEFSLPMVY